MSESKEELEQVAQAKMMLESIEVPEDCQVNESKAAYDLRKERELLNSKKS